MYEVIIILAEENNPTIEQYAAQIREQFKTVGGEAPKINVGHVGLQVALSGVEFSIVKNCQPYVNVEAKELVKKVKEDEQAVLSNAKCQFEVSSTDETGNQYDNELQLLIQAAEQLGKIWVYSPKESDFV